MRSGAEGRHQAPVPRRIHFFNAHTAPRRGRTPIARSSGRRMPKTWTSCPSSSKAIRPCPWASKSVTTCATSNTARSSVCAGTAAKRNRPFQMGVPGDWHDAAARAPGYGRRGRRRAGYGCPTGPHGQKRCRAYGSYARHDVRAPEGHDYQASRPKRQAEGIGIHSLPLISCRDTTRAWGSE